MLGFVFFRQDLRSNQWCCFGRPSEAGSWCQSCLWYDKYLQCCIYSGILDVLVLLHLASVSLCRDCCQDGHDPVGWWGDITCHSGLSESCPWHHQADWIRWLLQRWAILFVFVGLHICCCFKSFVLSSRTPPTQASTLRPAMFLWPWSSSLLTSLRVFTLIATRRTLELGIRSVFWICQVHCGVSGILWMRI